MPHPELILAALVSLSAAQASGAELRPWSALSQQEQAALAPLAGLWDRMPATQQDKLLAVARGYPRLSPDHQKRLHARLNAWSRMTAEERQIARENFKKIQSLPKQDQASIRQRWLDSLCLEFGKPASDAPAPGR